MDTIPKLVFERSARPQFLRPHSLGRTVILAEQVCKGDGRVQVDHRSRRSASSSESRASSDATGEDGGGSPGGTVAGLTYSFGRDVPRNSRRPERPWSASTESEASLRPLNQIITHLIDDPKRQQSLLVTHTPLARILGVALDHPVMPHQVQVSVGSREHPRPFPRPSRGRAGRNSLKMEKAPSGSSPCVAPLIHRDRSFRGTVAYERCRELNRLAAHGSCSSEEAQSGSGLRGIVARAAVDEPVACSIP